MRFAATSIPGVLLVDDEFQRDHRGYFARTFDDEAFATAGVPFTTRQCSTSFNERVGTLRGLHFQLPPAAETKLVRCTRGAVFDVAVDLRRDSSTFRRWFGVELTAECPRAVLIPRGCAHGFLTLADASEVFYQIDAPFAPAHGRGVRWDDPAFAIAWPGEPSVMAPRDANYPDFAAQ
jgi:dTDP-4-dehydrorhamnose 3,5-epimerase